MLKIEWALAVARSDLATWQRQHLALMAVVTMAPSFFATPLICSSILSHGVFPLWRWREKSTDVVTAWPLGTASDHCQANHQEVRPKMSEAAPLGWGGPLLTKRSRSSERLEQKGGPTTDNTVEDGLDLVPCLTAKCRVRRMKKAAVARQSSCGTGLWLQAPVNGIFSGHILKCRCQWEDQQGCRHSQQGKRSC